MIRAPPASRPHLDTHTSRTVHACASLCAPHATEPRQAAPAHLQTPTRLRPQLGAAGLRLETQA